MRTSWLASDRILRLHNGFLYASCHEICQKNQGELKTKYNKSFKELPQAVLYLCLHINIDTRSRRTTIDTKGRHIATGPRKSWKVSIIARGIKQNWFHFSCLGCFRRVSLSCLTKYYLTHSNISRAETDWFLLD